MPEKPDLVPFVGSMYRCRKCGGMANRHDMKCPVCSLEERSRAHAEQTGALANAAAGLFDDRVKSDDPKEAATVSDVRDRLKALNEDEPGPEKPNGARTESGAESAPAAS